MGKKRVDNMLSNDSGRDEETDYGLEEEVPKWYSQFIDEAPIDCKPPDENELNSLKAEAETVFEQETKHFQTKQKKSKSSYDTNWLKTMLTKGTTNDKIAAHVITVQNAPMYNMSVLQGLISMVKASKKHDCASVMENLSDLFLEDLLIPSKKLKTFDKQPLTKLAEITSGCARSRKSRLAAWMFEEKLKESYSNFISAVDNISKDTVDANRIKAISVMNKLLSGHPEHEQMLLKNLVNKLGDPNQKVVSKVVYSLTQLLSVHPNMKQVVMTEVEKFLFRPNLSTKAQYYSICFLTQFVFHKNDRDVARNIINIYFSFFKGAIKKGEVDSRLMGALLVGVKRAHPFASLGPGSMKEHTDTLYKLVHLSPFNVSVHALCLLQEVATEADDRFYNSLYKKLLDRDLNKSCHHAVFINLLAKAITKDTNISRVKAIIKRLLQVCLYVPAPLACGFLYLISYLFSKRTILLAFQSEPKNEITTIIKIEDEGEHDDDDDDGDEKYFDADKIEEIKVKEEPDSEEQTLSVIEKHDEDAESEEHQIEIKTDPDDIKPARGWVYKDLIKRKASTLSNTYDPLARNPAFSHADKSAYFELVVLSNHFHPTVSLFAKKILNSERIVYSGDPLADFTLVRFLDRFCFKNPKKIYGDEVKNGPDRALANRKYYKPSGAKNIHVLSRDYLLQDRSHVPVDELFLYKYLKDKHGDGKNFVKNEDDDDNDSVASEEFQEMLDGMIGVKKVKELDFMDDIGDKLKKKKGATDETDDFGSEEEEEEDDDNDEQENSEDDLGDDMDEDDFELEKDEAEALDFSDDGEEDDIDLDNEFFNKDSTEDSTIKKSKTKKETIKKNKVKGLKLKGGLEGLFAPAEEFSEILEEAGASKEKPGMVQSLSTSDNAATKQIAWETKRDRWVRNADSKKRKFRSTKKTFNGAKKRRTNH